MAMRLYTQIMKQPTWLQYLPCRNGCCANRDCDNIKPCRYVPMQMPPCRLAYFFFLLRRRNRFFARTRPRRISDFSSRSRKIDRYRSITARRALTARGRTRRRETDLSSRFYLFTQNSAFLYPFPFYYVMLFV